MANWCISVVLLLLVAAFTQGRRTKAQLETSSELTQDGEAAQHIQSSGLNISSMLAPDDVTLPTYESEVWLCDCGTLKDLDQEGQLKFNSLSQELSRVNSTASGKMDWFVNWKAISNEDKLIANPTGHSKYYKKGGEPEFTTYTTESGCMSSCLKSCNTDHWAAKRHGWGASMKTLRAHAFARCIPKRDFTCMYSIANPFGSRIEGALGLKPVSAQMHGLDFAVAGADAAPVEPENLRMTVLYTDTTYTDQNTCLRQCKKKFGRQYDQWTCNFYPAALTLKDAVMRRSMFENKVDVDFYGCCTASFYPGMCGLTEETAGRADEVQLERWRIPENYFVEACSQGLLTEATGLRNSTGMREYLSCEALSQALVLTWAIKGCEGTNGQRNAREHVYATTKFKYTMSSR